MANYTFSHLANQDLDEFLAYVIYKDGVYRASELYDQVIKKIEEIAEAPFELGQRKEGYLPNLRKIFYKRLNIYFTYKEDHVYIERIISGYRDQDKFFN